MQVCDSHFPEGSKMSKRATLLLALLTIAPHVFAQAIDPARSTVTVRVSKAGLFSAFGHRHTVRAPIQQGQVDTAARAVSLSFASAHLQVLDPDVLLKERTEIQHTMLGPQVRDAARYPEIRFQSTRVEAAGASAWRVQGELTLHGVVRPLALEVATAPGGYRGRALLKQSDFGIKPIS